MKITPWIAGSSTGRIVSRFAAFIGLATPFILAHSGANLRAAAAGQTHSKKQASKPAAGSLTRRASTPAASAPVKIDSGPLKPFTLDAPGSAAKIEMMPVPAGKIKIKTAGSGEAKEVEIKPFWICRTETTWEMFDAFTMSGPPSKSYDQTPITADAIALPSRSYIPPDSGWGHHGYPAIHISALSATMFCRWLSSKTGKKFRLPSEAEWEFACRAGGSGNPLPAGELDKVAWYKGNSGLKTHPVGLKRPNGLGLYDMLGNVGEWSTDLNGKMVLCGGAESDAAADVFAGRRAYQTPAWQEEDPQIPKSRWWLSDAHFAGFRIVCESE